MRSWKFWERPLQPRSIALTAATPTLPPGPPPLVPSAGETAALRRQLEEALHAKTLAERETKRARTRRAFTPGRDFVCVLPFCGGDAPRFIELLEWMQELGTVDAHAVLVAPAGLRDGVLAAAEQHALKVFPAVTILRTPFDLPRESWPIGPNWSFLVAAEYCRRQQFDFWLHEPDCIPLRAGWFDEIRAEYRQCGQPYMGFIEPRGEQHTEHLAGNACYHYAVFHHLQIDHLWKAWDVALADVLLPQTHRSELVHQVWGGMGKPPTFATVDDLRPIPPAAAVFHRNKDGTLIKVLRERRAAEAAA
jgi:hypothetical protein